MGREKPRRDTITGKCAMFPLHDSAVRCRVCAFFLMCGCAFLCGVQVAGRKCSDVSVAFYDLLGDSIVKNRETPVKFFRKSHSRPERSSPPHCHASETLSILFCTT